MSKEVALVGSVWRQTKDGKDMIFTEGGESYEVSAGCIKFCNKILKKIVTCQKEACQVLNPEGKPYIMKIKTEMKMIICFSMDPVVAKQDTMLGKRSGNPEDNNPEDNP